MISKISKSRSIISRVLPKYTDNLSDIADNSQQQQYKILAISHNIPQLHWHGWLLTADHINRLYQASHLSPVPKAPSQPRRVWTDRRHAQSKTSRHTSSERFGNEGANHQKKMGDCFAKHVFLKMWDSHDLNISTYAFFLVHVYWHIFFFCETNPTCVFLVFSVCIYLII